VRRSFSITLSLLTQRSPFLWYSSFTSCWFSIPNDERSTGSFLHVPESFLFPRLGTFSLLIPIRPGTGCFPGCRFPVALPKSCTIHYVGLPGAPHPTRQFFHFLEIFSPLRSYLFPCLERFFFSNTGVCFLRDYTVCSVFPPPSSDYPSFFLTILAPRL